MSAVLVLVQLSLEIATGECCPSAIQLSLLRLLLVSAVLVQLRSTGECCPSATTAVTTEIATGECCPSAETAAVFSSDSQEEKKST